MQEGSDGLSRYEEMTPERFNLQYVDFSAKKVKS